MKSGGINPDDTIVLGLAGIVRQFGGNAKLVNDFLKILSQESGKAFGKGGLTPQVHAKIRQLQKDAKARYRSVDSLLKTLL